MEDRVSRTQFQYTLEDPNADELNTFVPQDGGASCKQLPELRDVASDQQVNGLRAQAGLRSRHRFAPGHHAVDHRQHAVRRLRPAASLDHVHAVEPVSRGAGSEARVPKQSRRFAQSVHPLGARELPAAPGVVSGGSTNTAGFGPSSASVAQATAGQIASALPAARQRPARLSAAGRRHPRWFSPTAARCR